MANNRNIWLLVFFALTMFIWGVFYLLYGEKIEVNKGLGWDGKTYAAVASDFENFVSKGTLDRFYYKRIIPSVLVYYGHKALGIEFSIASVILGFSILNLILIMLGMFFWHKILGVFKISFKNRVIAFFGIFGTYAVVKVNFYYPILTDTTALFISLGMLYAYLRKSYWLVLLTAILGAFTFPTLFLMGAILLVFPKMKVEESNSKEDHYLIRIFPWTIPFVYASFFIFLWLSGEFFSDNNLWLTLLAVAANLVFLIWIGHQVKWSILIEAFKKIEGKWLAISLGSFIVISLLVEFFAKWEGQTVLYFLSHMTEKTCFAPFHFLVAHAVYYGPIILLIVLFHQLFFRYLYQQTYGVWMVIFVYLCFTIDPSSRQLIAGLPFLVIVLVQALDSKKLGKWFYFAFVISALLFSRFWFTINTGEFTGDPYQFPDQRYFMADGIYTNLNMFILQGFAVLILAGILFLLSKNTSSKTLVKS